MPRGMEQTATIFYSWQSDLPNATNRGFIERALESATRMLKASSEATVEPVVDRDTVGVSGSPDIASTIFSKIDRAAVFVADVSIILQPENGRATPNPNVLIELGYALRSLGSPRVIMVMNTAFGGPELLPFDLRTRRITTYTAHEHEPDRSAERKKLEQAFASALSLAIREASSSAPPPAPLPSTTDLALDAVARQTPERLRYLRTFMEEELAALDSLHPGSGVRVSEYDELVLAAIAGTTDAVERFSRISEALALADDSAAVREILRHFEPLLEKYNFPPGKSGEFNEADYDYHRFLGHELFVTLAAVLIREERWDRIRQLCGARFHLRNVNGTRTGTVGFDYISETLMSLSARKERLRSLQISLHADVLFERHGENGPLSRVVPMDDFMAADFLLFLRGEVQTEEDHGWMIWVPWSCVYMKSPPRYMLDAENEDFAKVLAGVLGAADVHTMKERIGGRMANFNRGFNRSRGRTPVGTDVIARIGSRS